MDISIPAIIFGLFFLFFPSTLWIGLSFLGMGLVLYAIGKRESAISPLPVVYPPVSHPASSPSGLSISRRDPTQPSEGMGIRNGVFSLPLPLDPNVSRFVDASYKVPTRAKDFIEEKEKKHPWLPEI